MDFFADKLCMYRNIAAITGLLWVGVVIIKLAHLFVSDVRAYFLAPYLGIGRFKFRRCGSWAVVTGASEGIGRGYAIELAKKGLNVVLMSRSRQKLQSVADEIEKKFDRETLIIPVDFSHGYNVYQKIEKQLQALDIGVLVNNVGIFHDRLDFMAEVPNEKLYQMLEVNCQPLVQMSRMILPGMVKKGRGVVINVSSLGSVMAIPLMTAYSASKIFINYISDGIRKEYSASSGVIVQNVTPGLVSTRINHFMPTSLLVPTPSAYTRFAIATVGIQENTAGYLPHAILAYVATLVPTPLLDAVLWKRNLERRRMFCKEMKSN